MAVEDSDGYWDIVVLSLQDICNANESLSFDDVTENPMQKIDTLNKDELANLKEDFNDHLLNIETAKRIISTSQQNLQLLISKTEAASSAAAASALASSPSQVRVGRSGKGVGKAGRGTGKKGNVKYGRLHWVSKFDSGEQISIGSVVAFRLKNRRSDEWIQCEVTKILADGTKFEIRDPEPDENNNPGHTFKATSKDILLVPSKAQVSALLPYPHGTKVLARYPETTTFYPAVVVGQKKDTIVRLKFDGEDEVNKETEVERRLVLPIPPKDPAMNRSR